uniref:Microtubule-associated protein 9 n=1 Tax=Kryptolebias marmoratus TaxID=37003 RepID=A0A3Q2Z9F7_KRYMA
MMADQEVTTLAYSKSPKTSKRTTFQDELQAAVSSRASRTKPEQLSNYMNIDDEEDGKPSEDQIKNLRKRMDAFKAGKSKAKLNTFDLSDDEENRRSRPKKVSFLKSQRSSSDPKDTAAPESHENGPLESPADPPGNDDASFSSQRSTNASEGNTQFKDEKREPPVPKPRQRTLGLKPPVTEKPAKGTASQDSERPQVSPVSAPVSADTPSNGVVSKSGLTSTPHSKTSERSRSVCSKKVDSKYLGTLRVLDRKVSLQESQPQSAESLRAAVYQEWLKKKREKSRENLQLKKEEQLLKEKAQQEQESKREDVAASYEAWREKKAESLRAKARERNEKIRKEQKATEEKQEKRQSAEQVFEQWKQERDRLLREKHRKHKEAKNKLQLQKRERDDERKKNSKSAFSDWCEKKKDVLHEKLERERKQIQTKAEEEQYMKEDRDKMALDTYESWLVRAETPKIVERQIRAIIGDSPPPPWSPPNKTVPFGK